MDEKKLEWHCHSCEAKLDKAEFAKGTCPKCGKSVHGEGHSASHLLRQHSREKEGGIAGLVLWIGIAAATIGVIVSWWIASHKATNEAGRIEPTAVPTLTAPAVASPSPVSTAPPAAP